MDYCVDKLSSIPIPIPSTILADGPSTIVLVFPLFMISLPLLRRRLNFSFVFPC